MGQSTRRTSSPGARERVEEGMADDDDEPRDLAARYDAEGMADELLRRWLQDPDAAEKWARLARDVRTDEDAD